MKIGLISDTHSYLDPKVEKYFRDVDEIWHAGDVGDISVLDELRKIKPVRGVYGNIDNHVVRSEFPEVERFTVENLRVLMIHIAGIPGRYVPLAKQEILKQKIDLFICGHSHILLVKQDKQLGHLHMNPGAAGVHGFHKVKTLLRFEITNGKIHNLEAIELGPRATAKFDSKTEDIVNLNEE